MKRVLSGFLILGILMSVLTACGQNAEENPASGSPEITEADSASPSAEDVEHDYLKDDLPNDVSYDGYTFRISASETEPEYIE